MWALARRRQRFEDKKLRWFLLTKGKDKNLREIREGFFLTNRDTFSQAPSHTDVQISEQQLDDLPLTELAAPPLHSDFLILCAVHCDTTRRRTLQCVGGGTTNHYHQQTNSTIVHCHLNIHHEIVPQWYHGLHRLAIYER